jgi:membrane dipeptidase
MANRREFMAWAAMLGTTARAGAAQVAAIPPTLYQRAIVIDALGGPGEDPGGGEPDAPLSPRAITDVRASGLTAVVVTVCEVGNGPERFEKAVTAMASMERELAAHPDVFLKVLRASDLGIAKASGRTGIIYTFQDATMLGTDLGRLKVFHGLGLRACQPTYNRRNLLGDGCLEAADGGLSQFGRDFVAEVNRLGILLDLSHAGRRTIRDGIAASQKPVAISHTGCRALADLPRNTDDEALRALADRGGVAGIYFMPFLRTAGQVHADDVIRHLEHAVEVCGEEHVGLGTDGVISRIELDAAFRESVRRDVEQRRRLGISAPGESADVFRLVPEYNEPRRFERLADDLARRGWTSGRIERILGANFARLYRDAWGA